MKTLLSLLLLLSSTCFGQFVRTEPPDKLLPPAKTAVLHQEFSVITPTAREMRLKVEEPGTAELYGYIIWFALDRETNAIVEHSAGWRRINRGQVHRIKSTFPEWGGTYAGFAIGIVAKTPAGVRWVAQKATSEHFRKELAKVDITRIPPFRVQLQNRVVKGKEP